MEFIESNDSCDDNIDWLEQSIHNEHIKYYEYSEFKNILKIGGVFTAVYQASLKYADHLLVLKSFNLINDRILEEIKYKVNKK